MENDGLTDARMRELYRRALADRGTREREGCVAPEAILAVVRRDGSEAKRLETLDHVMRCGACRAEFDLLRSIEQAGAEAAPPVRSIARDRWAWLSPVALAAALLLVVSAGVKLTTGGAPDVVRGHGDAITLIAPEADVDAGAPLTFEWRPVPGAVRYDLEVVDEQGNVVFGESTAEPTATLVDPASRLAPGTSYRWWVRASVGSGEPRASAMRRLRVK